MLIAHHGLQASLLARLLDSLVRVSRREGFADC